VSSLSSQSAERHRGRRIFLLSLSAIGALARFVAPGAVRIASSSFGTTGWNGQVMDVAFRDPDGTTVLVAHNENDDPQAVGVSEGGESFTYTLPGDSLATFTWPGNPGSSDNLRELGPSGWTATANPPGPTDPCCQGNVAANAVDDDASTVYQTGTGQQPGQWLKVDFGRLEPARFVRVTLTASSGNWWSVADVRAYVSGH
jgi:glucosylceramidase